jgi:hypothetical protein
MSKLRDIWNDIFSAIRKRMEKKASERNFRHRMASLERECRHWYDVTRLVH